MVAQPGMDRGWHVAVTGSMDPGDEGTVATAGTFDHQDVVVGLAGGAVVGFGDGIAVEV